MAITKEDWTFEIKNASRMTKSLDGMREQEAMFSQRLTGMVGIQSLDTFAPASKSIQGGFGEMTSSIAILGLMGDDQSNILRGIQSAVLSIVAFGAIFQLMRAFRLTQAQKEVALATAETIALGIAQQWQNIAIATAAAVGVSASFYAGRKIGSGDWDISGDVGTPSGRRQAMTEIRGVAT